MGNPRVFRAMRLAEQLRRVAGEWLELEQLDSPVLATVTDVHVTQDLGRAIVYFTVLGDETQRAHRITALQAKAGSLRMHVAREIRLRRVPDIELAEDALAPEVARIDALLAQVQASHVDVDPATLETDDDGPAQGAPVSPLPVSPVPTGDVAGRDREARTQ